MRIARRRSMYIVAVANSLICCGPLVAPALAQQPLVTSLAPDGMITWTNMSTNCVAVIEEFSPATSGEWITVYAELPTATVSQMQLDATNEYAWFRAINADNSTAPTNMVLIPGGSFQMGDNLGDGVSDEVPVHTVSVGPVYLARYEVTNDEMVQVMQWAHENDLVLADSNTVSNRHGAPQLLLSLVGSVNSNPIEFSGGSFSVDPAAGNHPCSDVSWYGAVAYCNYRSMMEGLTPCYDLNDWSCDWDANGYRLPTEAEWEKAARGGFSRLRFPWGDTISHSRANYLAGGLSYDLSSGGSHPDYDGTSPVGSFSSNSYGLYDMAGNVWEWCWDWYQSDWYEQPGASQSDTKGPTAGVMFQRIARGGSFMDGADVARCAYRTEPFSLPGWPWVATGFRCAKEP